MVDKADIAHRFNMAASTYDGSSFVQQEIGQRLLERVSLIKKKPPVILDIGSGTGFLTRQLQQHFPKSTVIGLDLAQGMSHFAKSNQPRRFFKNNPLYLSADTEVLPFKNQSIDLIFSNFTLQWCFNLSHVCAEFKRVLKPEGILFFSTLGPQTLYELRESFASVDNVTHVNQFADMHDIGDLLLNTLFKDPVIDMEMITVTYKEVKDLLHDLKATGAHNMNIYCKKTLTPKSHLAAMKKAYEKFKQPDGLYPCTYEIIYGHAMQNDTTLHRQDKDGVIRIPGNKLPLLT